MFRIRRVTVLDVVPVTILDAVSVTVLDAVRVTVTDVVLDNRRDLVIGDDAVWKLIEHHLSFTMNTRNLAGCVGLAFADTM